MLISIRRRVLFIHMLQLRRLSNTPDNFSHIHAVLTPALWLYMTAVVYSLQVCACMLRFLSHANQVMQGIHRQVTCCN